MTAADPDAPIAIAPVRATASEIAPIEVAMIADLACPWCLIGLVRLDRARALRPDLSVRLRWWPFFLNPQLPSEGMDRQAYLRIKFGGEESAKRVYARIIEAGAAEGIPFAFDRMPRTPNTLLAHRLVLLAESEGFGEPVIRALFEALFLEGRDIGRRDVLLEIAGQAGLEPAASAAFLDGDEGAAEVVRHHQRAQRLGVQGVPVFVAGGEDAIAGAQPAEVLVGLLDVARARAEGEARQRASPAAVTS